MEMGQSRKKKQIVYLQNLGKEREVEMASGTDMHAVP